MSIKTVLRPLAVALALPWALGAAPAPAYRALRGWAPMRDHIRLDTNVFLPPVPGRYPTILARTPYGKGTAPFAGYQMFLDHGYALVIQDVRGRYGSEGTWGPMTREGPDGYDTLEWIARQPWSDGRAVMSGGSYLGMVQWQAALLGNPHLKGIFPVVSGCDEYADRFYSPGGAMKLGHRLLWYAENFLVPGFQRPPFPDYVSHLPLRSSDRAATGLTIDAYQKALNHPAYDGFWKKASVCAQMDKIRVPVFSVGGWYDNYVESDLNAFARLSRLGRSPRLIVGPWPHNMSYKFPSAYFGLDSAAPVRRLQLQWYDGLLKGAVPATFHPGASGLRIFIMGANRWRDEHEWPLARARPTSLYLTVNHELAWNGPPAVSVAESYSYDPRSPAPTRGGAVCCDPALFHWGPMDQRPVERRPDVLVYSTPPLRHDLEATGPVEVRLWVSTSVRDTDFTAKLVDVFPDGEARNLTDGILRLRYRYGLDRPVLTKPGEIEAVTIDAGVTSNVFLAGHRIRLEISSSNFPRFDRNPNTGTAIASETKLKSAIQTVYHDQQHASQVVLPVVPEGAMTAEAPARIRHAGAAR